MYLLILIILKSFRENGSYFARKNKNYSSCYKQEWELFGSYFSLWFLWKNGVRVHGSYLSFWFLWKINRESMVLIWDRDFSTFQSMLKALISFFAYKMGLIRKVKPVELEGNFGLSIFPHHILARLVYFCWKVSPELKSLDGCRVYDEIKICSL